METSDLIGSMEAARLLGLSPLTLRKRVRRGDVTVYRDPLDDRRKLLRVQDLEALRRPRAASDGEKRPQVVAA